MARRLPARIVDLVNRPWDKASTHLQDIINAILDWLNDSWGGLQTTTKTIHEFAENNPDSTFDTGIDNHLVKFTGPSTLGVAMPVQSFDKATFTSSFLYEDAESFLKVQGTLASEGGNQFPTGAIFNFDTAGSVGGYVAGLNLKLGPGFSSSVYGAYGLISGNLVTSAAAHFGVDGSATGVTVGTGYNAGVRGIASWANQNLGVIGQAYADSTKANTDIVGVIGEADDFGTGTTRVGGWFRSKSGSYDPGASAALIADNVATTDPIARFRNNGVDQVLVGDGVPADNSQHFLEVIGTFPASPSASFVEGVKETLTTAGSAAKSVYGHAIYLAAGFTGAADTAALLVNNSAAGTADNLLGFGYNSGAFGQSVATTVGTNVGTAGLARGGNKSVAVLGVSTTDKNSATNIGGAFFGRNAGTTPIEIGVYAGLNTATPTFASAGLVADNAATTNPIALFRNNGTNQVLVGDGVPNDNSQHFLEVVGTLPSSPSLNPQGVLVNVTGAGSTSVGIEAATIFLKAGYTGSGYSEALNTSNFTAGTNTDLLLGGNVGAFGSSSATTTGTNVGFQADARGGNISAGVVGAATTAKNSATNIGVLGLGRNTGTTPIEVGGYFGLNTSNPTFTSAALIADNAAVAVPIFRARDNGTDVVRIADGGAVELSTISSIATNGSIQIGGTDVVTPGTSTWAGAERAAGQTDGSGGVLILHSGRGTGTGAGGDLHLQVAPASASSGTTQNALQNFLTASAANGNVNIGGVALSNAAPLTSNWAGAERAAGVADGGGGPVVIRSGRGTGTGPTGTVIIQLSPAAASTGTTQNTLRDVEKWDVSSVADPQSTDITLTGNNGGTMVRKSFSELLTLNTGSTTTDTTANLLPANAIILSVTTRVTTTITTATTFSVGDPTTAARFSATAGGLTAGSTRVGLQHQQGSVATDAAGPVQTTAAKVRITTDANPGAGVIRIQVWALVFAAPTS